MAYFPQLFTGLACFCLVGIVSGAPEPLPMKIPRVRTYGDLLSAPLVGKENIGGKDSDSVPKMHVGIDRLEAGLYDGVVLYLLLESPVDSFLDNMPGFRGDGLGPFIVRVEGPQFVPKAACCDSYVALQRDVPPGTHRLFMKTIPLYLAGKWKISLLTGERENPLAMAEVAVGKEMGTVWMSWRESRMELWEERGDKDVIAVSRVSNPSGSFAIPSTFNSDGSFWISHDMDRKRPLPALFPDKVAANTKIRVGTDLLTVKIDRPREIMFPHDHFLTRWWVNGKPVCSDLKPEVIESARQWSGPVPHVNEFQFSIRFDAKVYGVKEGDGIGLQLLFCPFGWDHASSEADELSFLSVLEEAPEGISLLLPRAEFIWKEGKLQPKTAGGTGVGVNTDNEGKR